MKERPILFSASMVQAILAGTKTQTRRVVKPQPPNGLLLELWYGVCPYGKVGDQLWVRETWNHDCYPYPISDNPIIHYRADYLDDPLGADLELSKDGIRRKWMPSIYMPRKASRIQLEITNVRVERLNDISEADAVSEGVEIKVKRIVKPYSNPVEYLKIPAVEWYRDLWESINGAGSWAANPWVWVIEFKRINHG